jgi:lycopene beta-cyclase
MASSRLRSLQGSWQGFVCALGETPLLAFLLTPWLLTMISLPILLWTLGDALLPWGVTASVLLQVATVLSVLRVAWGGRQTLQVGMLILSLAWAIEWMGSTTGWPFGAYRYTAALQPQLAGVPVLIPLAWLMMLPCAWAISYQITGQSRGWRFVITSALAFTAWDLFLDPQMVTWGYWVWTDPGGYFGIPWLNFAGWLASAALLTLVARPAMTTNLALLFIYVITWLLQTIGLLLFWQMPGPALVGFLGMGIFVILSVLRLR